MVLANPAVLAHSPTHTKMTPFVLEPNVLGSWVTAGLIDNFEAKADFKLKAVSVMAQCEIEFCDPRRQKFKLHLYSFIQILKPGAHKALQIPLPTLPRLYMSAM